MKRPVTLFTGQWADLTLEEVARLASSWGYDGLEIACSGEHLDVLRASEDDKYVSERLEILDRYNLKLFAISNHLKGQAVCDNPIDFRHEAIVGPRVWGDGDPEGVRQRAAEEMKRTAVAARKLGVDTVVGFTGSSIWQYVAMFPPVSQSVIDAGYEDFANRFNPIMNVFDGEGVRFALEVHPSEIAYDYYTTVKTLEAIDHREAFGLNWDPSHMHWQDIDPVNFILDFADRIYHVDCKDTSIRKSDGRVGRLGSHLAWDDPRRGWTFVSTGRGQIDWQSSFRALDSIGYSGPISVEWEDAGMDRLHGAPEALAFVRSLLWDQPANSFDSVFKQEK
ncbi:MAG: sugar phosphate isomerase/epimerase family protein [Micrococcales bacterium]